jgi:hypothetical protein
MLDATYTAWKADCEAGLSSLMIAQDTATAAELNRLARAERVSAGAVVEEGISLAGGQSAGVGDEVITRQNNRRLSAGRRWVKNGDRWFVTATNPDGSMALRRASGGGQVVLPAEYTAEHVELAYATTAYRTEGRTVDTAHAMVSPTTAREALYVLATRGRDSNRMYVDTAYDPDPQTSHDGTITRQTVREVLVTVLAREGADLSAHETIRREHHNAESWPTLYAEYQTLAAAAQADRWEALLKRSGLTQEQVEQVRSSGAHGPLLTAFRDAESHGLDIEAGFPELVRARSLVDALDVASVLHARVCRWTESAGSHKNAADNLIAGLVPRARGITDPDMGRALQERDTAMERRARNLAEKTVANGTVWVRKLGTPPSNPQVREQWMTAVSTIAAYRERWGIAGDNRPLGPDKIVTTIEHLGHRKRAEVALQKALTISLKTGVDPRPQVPAAAPSVLAVGRRMEI